ncbi:hypothetical protein ACFFHJ_40230 [Planotetraspora thailandica]|nr:hypothetical protein [Planotetraspora thailandica]
MRPTLAVIMQKFARGARDLRTPLVVIMQKFVGGGRDVRRRVV